MDMDFLDFFEENKCGFLATVDGKLPKVRPWSYLFEQDNKIWFLTTNKKRVFQQLKENPYIEFCSMSPEYLSGRLCGQIQFLDNLEIKKRILEERPILKEIYGSAENPVLELFYLEHGTVSFYSSRLEIDEFISF